MRHLLLPFALVAGLSGTVTVASERLPGSEWSPSELQGVALTPAQDIFLRFDSEGRYFGNGGCNTFRGQFVTNGDAILLSPAAATRMACPTDIMQQENEFFELLMTVRHYERSGTDLALSDAEGTVVLRFAQRDGD